LKSSDIIKEAKEMDALGASITGGEPLLAVGKACRYIKLLKKEFGNGFHIHLYTYGKLATEKNMNLLEKAGLDEIRFHALEDFENILPALKTKMKVGIEVPVIPKDWKRLKNAINFCAKHDIFINLNELEFSDSNWESMKKHGVRHPEETNAVAGSKALAMKALEYAERKLVKAHFCSVFVKHGVQMQRRLKRRAKVIKRPWEKVDKEGMIVKGVVQCKPGVAVKEGVYYSKEKRRIETTVQKARQIAKKYGLQAYRVREWPASVPWDFEADPI